MLQLDHFRDFMSGLNATKLCLLKGVKASEDGKDLLHAAAQAAGVEAMNNVALALEKGLHAVAEGLHDVADSILHQGEVEVYGDGEDAEPNPDDAEPDPDQVENDQTEDAGPEQGDEAKEECFARSEAEKVADLTKKVRDAVSRFFA